MAIFFFLFVAELTLSPKTYSRKRSGKISSFWNSWVSDIRKCKICFVTGQLASLALERQATFLLDQQNSVSFQARSTCSMNTESSLDTGVYNWFQKKEGTFNHHSKIIIPPKTGQTNREISILQPVSSHCGWWDWHGCTQLHGVTSI